MKASDLSVTNSNGRVYLLDIKGDGFYNDETVLMRFSYAHPLTLEEARKPRDAHGFPEGRLIFEPIASTLPLSKANPTTAIRDSVFDKYCRGEVTPDELPQWLHLPHKSPAFDRALKGREP